MIVALSNDDPLALVPADFAGADIIGFLVFAGLLAGLYGWAVRRSRANPG